MGTASFHVARPHRTPENFAPDSASQVERLGEHVVADARGKIDERLLRGRGGFAEKFFGFVARVGGFAFAGFGAGDERHVHGHFDFQNVHAVLRLRKFFHALGDDFGLLARVFDSLLVAAFFVAHKFQEKWHVGRGAFAADALDPGVLDVVDFGRIKRRVVEQNFDAVGAGGDEALHGPIRKQIGQAAGARVVVAAVLIGEQQAGMFMARAFAAGRPYSGSSRMALACGVSALLTAVLNSSSICAVTSFLSMPFSFANGTLQRAALVHGRRGDHAARIAHRFQALPLARGNFHFDASEGE